MSRTDGYYLLGPVNTGSKFFLAYTGKANNGDTLAYFLTVIPGTGTDPDTFVFDPRIDNATVDPNPPDQGPCMLTPDQEKELTDYLNAACSSDCDKLPPELRQFCKEGDTVKECEKQIPTVIKQINCILGVNNGCQNPNNSNNVPIGQLLLITAAPSSNGWSYSYQLPGADLKYLSVDANGNLVSSSTSTTFTTSQNEYANWNGVPFLSGVGYAFQVNGKQVIAQTYTANSVISIEKDGNKVPRDITIVTTTSNGNTIGVKTNVTSTIRAVQNEIYQRTGNTTCGGTALSQSFESEWVFSGVGIDSYTTASDCLNGFIYSYCTTGNTCGSSNCNGPCSTTDGAETCQFNSANQTYRCAEPDRNEPWYRQPWFIITVVIFGILLFILIIALIVRSEHKTKKEK